MAKPESKHHPICSFLMNLAEMQIYTVKIPALPEKPSQNGCLEDRIRPFLPIRWP
jgi:hypothetical protein